MEKLVHVMVIKKNIEKLTLRPFYSPVTFQTIQLILLHDGIQQSSLAHENPTTCRVLKLMTAFVNVSGRKRLLNPGPLSRRSDKFSTTPRS
jgi:hypothetical protein